MATITLTVNDAHVDRIVAALERRVGDRPVEESKSDFVKRVLRGFIISSVLDGDTSTAANDARDNFTEPDIT